MSYLRIISERFGGVTTRKNCEAILANGNTGCALAQKAQTVEGALDIARSFVAALADDSEEFLPSEVQAGKGADGYVSGTCIHASRIACATLIEAIDAGTVTHEDAVLAVQWTVSAGYGSKASIAQDPKDQPVTLRKN